jgi:hypothetical protein
MNEIEFKNINQIKNYDVHFKCFDGPDGYQATFHIYDKNNKKIHYQINFEISGTQYNTKINNSGKLTKIYIDEKYGNLEKCFEDVGYKYLVGKISTSELKNETINLISHLSL